MRHITVIARIVYCFMTTGCLYICVFMYNNKLCFDIKFRFRFAKNVYVIKSFDYRYGVGITKVLKNILLILVSNKFTNVIETRWVVQQNNTSIEEKTQFFGNNKLFTFST